MEWHLGGGISAEQTKNRGVNINSLSRKVPATILNWTGAPCCFRPKQTGACELFGKREVTTITGAAPAWQAPVAERLCVPACAERERSMQRQPQFRKCAPCSSAKASDLQCATANHVPKCRKRRCASRKKPKERSWIYSAGGGFAGGSVGGAAGRARRISDGASEPRAARRFFLRSRMLSR